MTNADYRRHNDGSKNSRTYHKKDGTPVRAILKRESADEAREFLGRCMDRRATERLLDIALDAARAEGSLDAQAEEDVVERIRDAAEAAREALMDHLAELGV